MANIFNGRSSDSFEDKILQLAMADADACQTPVPNPPDLARSTSSSSFYSEQFLPYITEDIRFKIADEINNIRNPKGKARRPTESEVLPKESTSNTFQSLDQLHTISLSTPRKICRS